MSFNFTVTPGYLVFWELLCMGDDHIFELLLKLSYSFIL